MNYTDTRIHLWYCTELVSTKQCELQVEHPDAFILDLSIANPWKRYENQTTVILPDHSCMNPINYPPMNPKRLLEWASQQSFRARIGDPQIWKHIRPTTVIIITPFTPRQLTVSSPGELHLYERYKVTYEHIIPTTKSVELQQTAVNLNKINKAIKDEDWATYRKLTYTNYSSTV